MKIIPPGRLASSVASSAFLRAGERDELAAARTDLVVVGASIDYAGSYGPQVLFWLQGPWPAERVLALEATDMRRHQVTEIRDRLRHAEGVGPFRLARRRTTSGRRAWALVDPAEDTEQLAIKEDA